jgi:hypothetical protein
MPKGRPKKIVSIVENVVEANPNSIIELTESKIEDIKEDKKFSYEFEEHGKKYRKSFDKKGNSLGVVEL